jgi:hypothetical protein
MSLAALIEAQLDMPAPPALRALGQDIVARHGDSVAAILFYGSCRRTGDLSGLADLYVLYTDHHAYHRDRLAAWLTALLPPHVSVVADAGGALRAKVASLSVEQFARRMQPGALDTTVWTRFAQPASLIYVRDAPVRRAVVQALVDGIRTSVFWARHLAPGAAAPVDVWQALFAQTYRTELRVEREVQPARLYAANAAWFDAILAAVAPTAGRHRWRWRRLLGRPLNVLRLIKAAFTFEQGAEYLVWKIERHSGVRLELTEWQRRHPILAAPVMLWRLRRLGALD